MTDEFEEWILASVNTAIVGVPGETFEEFVERREQARSSIGRAPVCGAGDTGSTPVRLTPRPVFGEAPDERQWIHNFANDEWTAPDGSVFSGAGLTREQVREIAVQQRSERVFTPYPLFGELPL